MTTVSHNPPELHTHWEFATAKQLHDMLLHKNVWVGLSENEALELSELSARINKYPLKKQPTHASHPPLFR